MLLGDMERKMWFGCIHSFEVTHAIWALATRRVQLSSVGLAWMDALGAATAQASACFTMAAAETKLSD